MFFRYLPEWEKNGMKWSKAGVLNHTRFVCCYLRKLVLGFAGREVKDVLKEMILVS